MQLGPLSMFDMKTIVLFLLLATAQALPLTTAPALPRNLNKWDRTCPSNGDLVVRPNPATASEFGTISEAVKSLAGTGGSIFVYPGVYHEQVSINSTGNIRIQGYTKSGKDHKHNQVTITNGINAQSVGKNDLSATVRAESAGISLYNLNIENTYGHYADICECQALALSAQAGKQGYYGLRLVSWQDTLLANVGVQLYAKSHIEGAFDFIFGQHAPVYIHDSTLATTSAGSIVAPGRLTNTDPQIFVIADSKIVPSKNTAANTTGNTFLGRPWKEYGRVVYRDSYIGSHINPEGYSIWSNSTPNVNTSLLAEYNNYGPGSYSNNRKNRASFAKLLTKEESKNYTISAVLGEDYESWTDADYLD